MNHDNNLLRRLFVNFVRVSVSLTIFSAASILPQSQLPFDMNEMVHDEITGERDCVKADWQFAELARTSGLFKGDSLPTQSCKAVTLRWLPSAQIVQVTGVMHRDVFVSLTVLRASEKSPLRIILALGGMVSGIARENDEANKSVFNELLEDSAYKPTDNQMLDLGALYLFMVGHPPDETPKRMSDFLADENEVNFTERKNGWITTSVRKRKSMPVGNVHGNWILRFHIKKRCIKLVSVIPE